MHEKETTENFAGRNVRMPESQAGRDFNADGVGINPVNWLETFGNAASNHNIYSFFVNRSDGGGKE